MGERRSEEIAMSVEIWPHVWLGTFVDAQLEERCVVLCVHENPIVLTTPNSRGAWIPIMRGSMADMIRLDAAASFIESCISNGEDILVHCHHAVERSPLTIAWYLHTKQGMSLDAAYQLLWHHRPQVQDRRCWLIGEAAHVH